MIFNFLSKHKKVVMTFFSLTVLSSLMFAENSAATGMANTVNNIVAFFDSGWVKGIACVALIAECIGLFVSGGQNPQIFKKFLPIIAGTVIFMCAGKIINLIFNGFGTDTITKDLAGSTSFLLPEKDSASESNKFRHIEFNLA